MNTKKIVLAAAFALSSYPLIVLDTLGVKNISALQNPAKESAPPAPAGAK